MPWFCLLWLFSSLFAEFYATCLDVYSLKYYALLLYHIETMRQIMFCRRLTSFYHRTGNSFVLSVTRQDAWAMRRSRWSVTMAASTALTVNYTRIQTLTSYFLHCRSKRWINLKTVNRRSPFCQSLKRLGLNFPPGEDKQSLHAFIC